MKTYYVYLWTNLKNGKSYVGKGRENRCNVYLKESLKEEPNGLLSKAMKKYGVDTFYLHFLEMGLSEKDAHRQEIYWIAELNTNVCRGGHGYNLTDGGEGSSGYVKSPDTCQRLSVARKGKKQSPRSLETRKRIGAAHKGKPKSSESRKKMSDSHKGKTLTPETRQKMSQSHRRRHSQKRSLESSEPSNKFATEE